MKNTMIKIAWTISVFVWMTGAVIALLVFFWNPFTILVTAPIVWLLWATSEKVSNKIKWSSRRSS